MEVTGSFFAECPCNCCNPKNQTEHFAAYCCMHIVLDMSFHHITYPYMFDINALTVQHACTECRILYERRKLYGIAQEQKTGFLWHSWPLGLGVSWGSRFRAQSFYPNLKAVSFKPNQPSARNCCQKMIPAYPTQGISACITSPNLKAEHPNHVVY